MIGQFAPAVVFRLCVLATQIGQQGSTLVVVAEQDITDVQRRQGLHVKRASVEFLEIEGPVRNRVQKMLHLDRGSGIVFTQQARQRPSPGGELRPRKIEQLSYMAIVRV